MLNKRNIQKDLNAYLKILYNMGDQDECSYKHNLHGLTSLYWLDSWEKMADYTTPGQNVSQEQIKPYWDEIAKIFKQVGKKKFKKLVEKCDDGSYMCDYRMDIYNELLV